MGTRAAVLEPLGAAARWGLHRTALKPQCPREACSQGPQPLQPVPVGQEQRAHLPCLDPTSGFLPPRLLSSPAVPCPRDAGPPAPSDAVWFSQFPACRLTCSAPGDASSATTFQLTSQRMEASLKARKRAPKIEAPQGHRVQFMTAMVARSHRMERTRERVQSKEHILSGTEASPVL